MYLQGSGLLGSHRQSLTCAISGSMNVVCLLITSGSKIVEDVLFTVYVVKKCGLNNGRFLAVVALLYIHLLDGGKIDTSMDAPKYLSHFIDEETLKARLKQCCFCVGAFDPHAMLRAFVLAWMLHNHVQPWNGYRLGSFANEPRLKDPHRKLVYRANQPYLYGIQIPIKFPSLIQHVVSFAQDLKTRGSFYMLCSLERRAGVFVAQQITQMLPWQSQIQAVWQPQNEICAYLTSRKVYPGPGVRKLMLESSPHAPQAKKTKTSSRLRLSLGDADRVFCSVCFEVLARNPPSFLKRLGVVAQKDFESTAFEEQFSACELGCNIARTSRRTKQSHWTDSLASFFSTLVVL